MADYAPTTEVIQTLARYLSDLTLTDEEGIGFCRLPEGKIPLGFHLIYKRPGEVTGGTRNQENRYDEIMTISRLFCS